MYIAINHHELTVLRVHHKKSVTSFNMSKKTLFKQLNSQWRWLHLFCGHALSKWQRCAKQRFLEVTTLYRDEMSLILILYSHYSRNCHCKAMLPRWLFQQMQNAKRWLLARQEVCMWCKPNFQKFIISSLSGINTLHLNRWWNKTSMCTLSVFIARADLFWQTIEFR